MSALFNMPYQSTPSLKEKNASVHELLLLLSNVTVLMQLN